MSYSLGHFFLPNHVTHKPDQLQDVSHFLSSFALVHFFLLVVDIQNEYLFF